MIFTTRAMQEIKDRLKGLGLASSTIKTYSNILQNFFKHIGKTTNITEQEINDYLDHLIIVKNYSGRSRNLAMKIIRFYCREFLNLKIDIKKAKETKPIPKICEDNEFTQIMSVTQNIKHKLCLYLMRYSGLRKGEAIKVMKHHIQPDGRLFVKEGKGNKDRYTIIPPQILEQLNAFISLLPVENPYIFQTHKGHYSPMTPQKILHNAFKKLGWHKSRWFGCHALRHSFTLWCVDSLRLDFDEVSKMLGHSAMRTTQIYTQCRRINLQRAIEVCKDVSIIT